MFVLNVDSDEFNINTFSTYISLYVTRYEKIGLMCTQNLTTFLDFKLTVKNNGLIQFLPFMQGIKCNSESFNILNSKRDIYHNTKRCILCT